ncbi:MAG: putative toxin-antitoxin system toxin component, PIN family [Nitrospirae bacterium]|nr:putative toxin-antitoxin system toxin component, PIN family [Nitrospirota bacterium]
MDTGVLVSAFVFGGVPEKAVKKAFAEAEIFVSPTLLKEYRSVPLVLESEEKIDHIQLKVLISGIAAFVARANVIQPQKRLFICRDAKDNMLLECCLEAGANFLVTGDKDLLDMTDLPFKLKILTPQRFTSEG